MNNELIPGGMRAYLRAEARLFAVDAAQPLKPAVGLTHRERQLNDAQTGSRRLVPLPRGLVPEPLQIYLDPKDKAVAHRDWRVMYDAGLDTVVVMNAPGAVAQPRGVAVLLHGVGAQRSTPATMFGPANQLNKLGFLTVILPQPFHCGFGPSSECYMQLDAHMQWLQRAIGATKEYYACLGGALPAALVGRSTGANQVLELASREPDSAQAFVALSPYHPAWSDVCGMRLRAAEQYGLAELNRAGMAWNQGLDPQWTFSRGVPISVDASAMTESDVRGLFEQGRHTADPRRAYFDAMIETRVPRALLGAGELVRWNFHAVQQLAPFPLPPASVQGPLAKTSARIFGYTAAPDMDLTPASAWHPAVWPYLAPQNDNVAFHMAPRGEHDPFMDSPAVGVFRSTFSGWLCAHFATDTDRMLTRQTATYRDRLTMAHTVVAGGALTTRCADDVMVLVHGLAQAPTVEAFSARDKGRKAIVAGLWRMSLEPNVRSQSFIDLCRFLREEGVVLPVLPDKGRLKAGFFIDTLRQLNVTQVFRIAERLGAVSRV